MRTVDTFEIIHEERGKALAIVLGSPDGPDGATIRFDTFYTRIWSFQTAIFNLGEQCGKVGVFPSHNIMPALFAKLEEHWTRIGQEVR